MPRAGRGAGLGPHQGGQDHPQGDQEVPGRWEGPVHGPPLRRSLPEHPLAGKEGEILSRTNFFIILISNYSNLPAFIFKFK